FFFQAEDGIRDPLVTGVQTCALPILKRVWASMMVSAVWIPALAIVGLWFFGSRGGPVVAIQVYDVAAALTALGAWAWWRRITPEIGRASCREGGGDSVGGGGVSNREE